MRRFLLSALSVACAFSADYSITKKTSLSAAAEVITIQQPSSGARSVRFEAATLYCSVACEVTLERDGSAASSTALTVNKLAGSAVPNPTVQAFSSSNVGSGTVLARYNVPAGSTLVVDLGSFGWVEGSNRNITFRTDAITGVFVINVFWTEGVTLP